MTFLAPARPADLRGTLFGRRAAKPKDRARIADEDGARLALGADARIPVAALTGTSVEHLARIALG